MGTTTLTPAEAGLVGGMMGAMFGGIMAIALVCWILTIIASWKIFKKAGEPGWKAIIPIYNLYIMYKIVGMAGWFWANVVITIVMCVVLSVSGYNPSVMDDAQLTAYFSNNLGVVIGLVLCMIFAIVVQVLYSYRMSKAFGHGAGYAIGLFFLPFIFWLVIGFGQSKYDKKAALKK